MSSRKITQTGWRWHIAQVVLRILYGRHYHFISPWKSAGIAAAVVLIYERKIVLGRRRGNIEDVGKWSFMGGFVDLGKSEPILDGLVRECWEEGGLEIDKAAFDGNQPFCIVPTYDKDFIELAHETHITLFWPYLMTADDRAMLQDSDEAENYTEFTYAEVVKLFETGAFAHPENRVVLEKIYELGLID